MRTAFRNPFLGIVKLTARRRFALEIVRGFYFSAGTRRRLPVSESSLPQESMMDRFEMMTCVPEQVVNRAVDREESLKLCR